MNNNLLFIKKISKYLFPYKKEIFFIIILSIFTAGLNLLPLQIMATFVDLLSNNIEKTASRFLIKLIGKEPLNYIFAFAIIYISSSLIMQLYGYIVSTLGFKICEDIRSDAFKWIMNMPKLDSNPMKEGDLVSRVISDSDIVSDAIVIPLRGLVVSVLELVWALLLLYTWSPLLSIVAFSIVPLLYVLGKWSYLHTKKLARSKQSSLGQLTDVVSESLRLKRTIKGNEREKSRFSFFQEYNKNATRSSIHIAKFFAKYWPLIRFINTLGVTLTIGIAYKLLQLKMLTPEDLMVAYLYCLRVYDPILDFTRYNMMISSADAALGRILELNTVN